MAAVQKKPINQPSPEIGCAEGVLKHLKHVDQNVIRSRVETPVLKDSQSMHFPYFVWKLSSCFVIDS